MPRPNPRQASYLNRHSGTAHFYYIRRIPAELRPKLIGKLRVEPGNRRYTLRGQLTIKVSLGTSDPRLAEKRMRIVNGDVQRILEAGSPPLATGRLPLTVSSLSPVEIKALADEHYRALLAIDDEVSIDPRCDPQRLRSHAAMAGEDVTSPEFRIADRWATWVEFMSHLSAEDLKSRNLERYDRPIELEDEDGSEVRIDSIVDGLLARQPNAVRGDEAMTQARQLHPGRRTRRGRMSNRVQARPQFRAECRPLDRARLIRLGAQEGPAPGGRGRILCVQADESLMSVSFGF